MYSQSTGNKATASYMDHLVKQAIEMWLHPNSFNRPLSQSKKTET